MSELKIGVRLKSVGRIIFVQSNVYKIGEREFVDIVMNGKEMPLLTTTLAILVDPE